jgi:hypothetical protein
MSPRQAGEGPKSKGKRLGRSRLGNTGQRISRPYNHVVDWSVHAIAAN